MQASPLGLLRHRRQIFYASEGQALEEAVELLRQRRASLTVRSFHKVDWDLRTEGYRFYEEAYEQFCRLLGPGLYPLTKYAAEQGRQGLMAAADLVNLTKGLVKPALDLLVCPSEKSVWAVSATGFSSQDWTDLLWRDSPGYEFHRAELSGTSLLVEQAKEKPLVAAWQDQLSPVYEGLRLHVTAGLSRRAQCCWLGLFPVGAIARPNIAVRSGQSGWLATLGRVSASGLLGSHVAKGLCRLRTHRREEPEAYWRRRLKSYLPRELFGRLRGRVLDSSEGRWSGLTDYCWFEQVLELTEHPDLLSSESFVLQRAACSLLIDHQEGGKK